MNPPAASREEKLRALRARFVADLPGLLDDLDRACRGAAAGGAASVQEAYRHAHTLAGTAGTFGLMAVAAESRALEAACRAALDAGAAPDGEDLRRRVDLVRAAVASEAAP